MRRILISALVIMLVFTNASDAFAWNALTHYHINHDIGLEPSIIFGMNGTGPDMSVQLIGTGPEIPDERGNAQSWPDYFHSPDLKIVKNARPYLDKPNFAYLMLKVAEKDGVLSSKAKAQAFGWGGHIAADWVAHNDNLFPICPDGSLGSIKHFIGESLCELYSYLSEGPINSASELSTAFDDRQIYKALYNYRLISIHESFLNSHQQVSDRELKEKAFQTTLPLSYIRGRIKLWLTKLAVIQFAYTSRVENWGSFERTLFMDSIEKRGIKNNLSLSRQAVYSWINNPTPRGKIPDYSRQITPFYSERLLDIPEEAALGGLPQGKVGITGNYGSQMLAANPVEEDMLLWQSVIDNASQKGQLSIDDTETPDGLYQVSVAINDQDGLKSTILDEVNSKAGSQEDRSGVGSFWKKLLVEGVASPDVLTDISPPKLTIISPQNGSFTNRAAPEIAVRVQDELDGSGVNTDTALLSIDGHASSYVFNEDTLSCAQPARLRDGLHHAKVMVSDKAGNTGQLEWSFTVDTAAPKLCYRVKNSVISLKRPIASVEILPNEPVSYCLDVFPVLRGSANLNTPIFQQKLGQQRMLSWGGTDGRGFRVKPGNYLMRIQAVDFTGNIKTLKISLKVQ